jgi:hypothetical protein
LLSKLYFVNFGGVKTHINSNPHCAHVKIMVVMSSRFDLPQLNENIIV